MNDLYDPARGGIDQAIGIAPDYAQAWLPLIDWCQGRVNFPDETPETIPFPRILKYGDYIKNRREYNGSLNQQVIVWSHATRVQEINACVERMNNTIFRYFEEGTWGCIIRFWYAEVLPLMIHPRKIRRSSRKKT